MRREAEESDQAASSSFGGIYTLTNPPPSVSIVSVAAVHTVMPHRIDRDADNKKV